jgi:predicted transcriptional regulator
MLEIEINYIRDNYRIMKIKDIADDLGVCEGTIRYHAEKLGIEKKNYLKEKEDDYLRENYPMYSAKRIAKILGKDYGYINRKLKAMGLKKVTEIF